MNTELTIAITLICTSTVLNLYICLYVFAKRKRYKSIANVFILHSLFVLIYCLGSVFVLMSTTIEDIKLWNTVLYAGMPFSATMGLIFIMNYVGINLSRKFSWALMIIPTITFLFVATNDFHHLHYRVLEIDHDLGAPYVKQEWGIWYIIHGFYTFGSMLVAFLLVLSRWKETSSLYRPQLLALAVGQLIPIITAFVYLLGLTPPGIDPVPMVMWLTSLFYLWSISTSRMFTLIPVAKDAIFNSINDGVIVLDEANRLIECNNASRNMFPSLQPSKYGMRFSDVWASFAPSPFPHDIQAIEANAEIVFPTENSVSTYQVRTANVKDATNSEGVLLIFTDITEIKRLQDKLEYYAYYDELTGIFNRRAFFERSLEAFKLAKQEATPYIALLMDIDHFKKVNDTYGHAIGDEVLEHVSNVCQTSLQNEGIFARYGGEEFVISLEGDTEVEGAALGKKLRQQVEAHALETSEGKISVTLSLGVASATGEPGETIYDVLNHADQALYAAKESGRNRVICYSDI